MKGVKKLLFMAAVILCAVATGLFIISSNSNPLPELDDYQRKTVDPGEAQSSRNVRDGEEEDISLAGPESNFDLEKEVINDRHKQIALKYKSQFARLQSQYQGELDNMLENAKADLDRIKNDESKASLIKLAYSYLKKGNALEDECDQRFYSLLNDMEDELRRENLPLDLVDEAEREYKARKDQRREHLLSMAREYIKGND